MFRPLPFLLAITAISGCAAHPSAPDPYLVDESQPGVTALSDHGRYRLRVREITQSESPWNKGVSALSMRFTMEFPAPGKTGFMMFRPENVFLDGQTLVSAWVMPEKNIAGNRHYGGPENFMGCGLEIGELETGQPLQQLHRLELAVDVVTVTEWETLEFKILETGETGFLHCGPFELMGQADTNRLAISAGACSIFESEHKEYQKRIPLGFLTHHYAMNLDIKDSAGREPSDFILSGSGGSSNFTFHFSDPSASPLPGKTGTDSALHLAVARTEPVQIKYPVTITLRLPKHYQTDRVKFQFDDLALPAPLPSAPAPPPPVASQPVLKP